MRGRSQPFARASARKGGMPQAGAAWPGGEIAAERGRGGEDLHVRERVQEVQAGPELLDLARRLPELGRGDRARPERLGQVEDRAHALVREREGELHLGRARDERGAALAEGREGRRLPV